MSTICIIPARGGSTRIPGKNIKWFHGKPIISYSIEKAQESELFDRIIVSTDDEGIANCALFYGVEVWMRDPAYAVNEVGTQEVVKECLKGIKARKESIVCCIYATAPLMSVKDLTDGYFLMEKSFCLSVGYPPLQDAGQFYWGWAGDFMDDIPLINKHTRVVCVVPERVCDINTPYDWARAEKMYEELMK